MEGMHALLLKEPLASELASIACSVISDIDAEEATSLSLLFTRRLLRIASLHTSALLLTMNKDMMYITKTTNNVSADKTMIHIISASSNGQP